MAGKIRVSSALFLAAILFCAGIGTASAQLTAAESAICTIMSQIKMMLTYVAGAIMAVVITMQGIKWTASGEDAGARKQAKEAIIHALVGLTIVVLGGYLVTMFPFSNSCPLPAV